MRIFKIKVCKIAAAPGGSASEISVGLRRLGAPHPDPRVVSPRLLI